MFGERLRCIRVGVGGGIEEGVELVLKEGKVHS